MVSHLFLFHFTVVFYFKAAAISVQAHSSLVFLLFRSFLFEQIPVASNNDENIQKSRKIFNSLLKRQPIRTPLQWRYLFNASHAKQYTLVTVEYVQDCEKPGDDMTPTMLFQVAYATTAYLNPLQLNSGFFYFSFVTCTQLMQHYP